MISFNQLGYYGRLGNQLFQYATLFAIGKIKNCDIGIPINNANNLNPYNKLYLTECFANLSAKDSSSFKAKFNAKEKQFTYNPGIYGILDDTDLAGYFQSEKYFVKYREELLKEFLFKPEILNAAQDIRSLTKKQAISLHIRLGDYVHLQNVHPVCGKDYYAEALSILPDDLLVYIFSDEPEKALNLLGPLNRKFVVPESTNQYVDMCAMSLCDYHVIANSSFSWWGSWLSNSKKTIAPSKWFGSDPSAPKNWSDIYCDGWHII